MNKVVCSRRDGTGYQPFGCESCNELRMQCTYCAIIISFVSKSEQWMRRQFLFPFLSLLHDRSRCVVCVCADSRNVQYANVGNWIVQSNDSRNDTTIEKSKTMVERSWVYDGGACTRRSPHENYGKRCKFPLIADWVNHDEDEHFHLNLAHSHSLSHSLSHSVLLCSWWHRCSSTHPNMWSSDSTSAIIIKHNKSNWIDTLEIFPLLLLLLLVRCLLPQRTYSFVWRMSMPFGECVNHFDSSAMSFSLFNKIYHICDASTSDIHDLIPSAGNNFFFSSPSTE